MASKKQKSKSTSLADLDDNPVDNPYPEFEDELFEFYLESGFKPEELTEPERTKFAGWLKARKT